MFGYSFPNMSFTIIDILNYVHLPFTISVSSPVIFTSTGRYTKRDAKPEKATNDKKNRLTREDCE